MKRGTLVILSVAAVGGMTSLANATPIGGVNDFISGGGSGISQTAQMEVGPIWLKTRSTLDQV